MGRVTTKSHILEYLKVRGGWISGSELEHQADTWGTKASVISRRARELVASGTILRILGNKHTVQYKLAIPKVFLGEVKEDIEQSKLFELETKQRIEA